ncbi:hypothetical protein [Salibacterium aidingense]|uniref:hypothetical protein n=1 Tax=Salibacterium aidingense TaxID=384933 RepID=UPI003BC3629C
MGNNQWYKEMKNKSVGQLTAFKKMQKPLQQFHDHLRKIHGEIGTKDKEAEQLLQTLNDKTMEIVELLQELQKEYKAITSQKP